MILHVDLYTPLAEKLCQLCHRTEFTSVPERTTVAEVIVNICSNFDMPCERTYVEKFAAFACNLDEKIQAKQIQRKKLQSRLQLSARVPEDGQISFVVPVGFEAEGLLSLADLFPLRR